MEGHLMRVAFLFLGLHMDAMQVPSMWTFLSSLHKRKPNMHATTTIINCLKKHGQLLDLEISEETGIPLSAVRFSLSDLSERGEISRCSVTRYDNGKSIKGSLCRIAGFSPTFSMNRRAAAKNKN
jgi:hypothetical protein